MCSRGFPRTGAIEAHSIVPVLFLEIRMYAIAILRYRRPLEEVLKVVEVHRAYLRSLKEKGILLASGPLDPRSGGALVLRVPDEDTLAALDRIRDEDPFTKAGVAQYELLPWIPNIGKEGLDAL
jgi:uncharacterized protein YciI